MYPNYGNLSRGVQALLTLLIHQIKVLFRDTPRKRGDEENGKMVKFCRGQVSGGRYDEKGESAENGAFGNGFGEIQ